MEEELWVLIGCMGIVIVVLLVKIHQIHKASKEIEEALNEKLMSDTNTLIALSSSDRYMAHLANTLNGQLRKLRSERHRFRQGDLELKQAVANISHDLRTPLTAIYGYLDLLEQEEKKEEVWRYAQGIRERADRLKQLMEEFFQYALIVSKENQSQKEWVVINSVLEESVASFYTVLTERKIEPIIQMPPKEVISVLDRLALGRVFANLLSNAVKYSAGDLEITLLETGEVRFVNTAFGLNGVEVERLFDRFYTVNTARKSTGLGLTIARTLIEQMGGTIGASYTNGKLAICLRLPKEEEAKKSP